ncbi:HEC/Ndc80p family-domain-containing protein [Absidia repens]|uniref:Kinetochore protein NDC80 n=1 Tax=Absidia repens TaxID=90262 RepID=A0A1X2IBZ3_9FUNG|nr:HEC/Ndc80p family-domain-containing protein [Absidia repens]
MDFNKPQLPARQLKQTRYTISEYDKRLYSGPSSSYPHKAPRMTMDGTMRKHPPSPLPPSSHQHHQQPTQQSQSSHISQQQPSYQSHLSQHQPSQQSQTSQQHDNTQSQTRRITMGRKLPKAFLDSPEVKLFNSGGGMPRSTAKVRDTRDIRSVDFQRHAIRIIIEYLNKYQYGLATSKTLRGLSAKEFENIFKFLFLRLTSDYVFDRKFEDEFFDLLRTIRYPFVDSISPKSLYSIAAPHSLPRYLALLSWMVQSCSIVDRRRYKIQRRLEQEGIIDTTKGMSSTQMDRLFLDYSVAKYNAFMQGKDGQEVYDELKAVFRAINKSNIDRYNNILAEKEAVLNVSKTLDERLKTYDETQEKMKKIEERIAMYKDTITNHQQKIQRYTSNIQKIEADITYLTTAEQKLQKEMDETKALIKNPEVTDEEIKRLGKLQSDLDMDIDRRRQTLDKLRQSSWEMEMQVQRKRNDIERIVADYNELIKSTDILPPEGSGSAHLTETLVFNSNATSLEDMLYPQLGKDMISVMQQYSETLKESLTNLQKTDSQLQFEYQGKQEQLYQEQQEQKKSETTYTKRMQQLNLERKEAKEEIQKYTDSKDQISRASDKLKRDALVELVQARSEQRCTLLELDARKMNISSQKSSLEKQLNKIASEIDAISTYIPAKIDETMKEFDRLFPLDLDLDST